MTHSTAVGSDYNGTIPVNGSQTVETFSVSSTLRMAVAVRFRRRKALLTPHSDKLVQPSFAAAESGLVTANGKQQGKRLRCDLRASLLDGAAFGGMVGFGETYLPAFVLASDLGEMVAGMVGSVPLVAGGLMQLASPMAVRLLRSHRR